MARKSKKNIVSMIKELVANNNISENAKMEYDFLIEEFEVNPKEVTMEDLEHFLDTLKKEGLSLEDKAPEKEEEVTVPENKENENKGEDEEMKATLNNKKANKNIKKKENSTKTVKKPAKNPVLKMTEIEEGFEFKPFPKTLNIPELGKAKLRTDIKTLGDLAELIEQGANIVIANVWTKPMLATYEYDPMGILDDADEFDEFPNDLDLLQPTFCTERVMYAVSLYTEVHTTYPSVGFEQDEDHLRNNGFLNYQVYEIAE